MKRNYLRSLLLLAAMVWAVPKTAAADYELSVNTTPEWVHTFSNPSLYARGVAIGPDYKIYTLDNNNTVAGGSTNYKSFYKIGSDGAAKYSFGTTKAVGAKICNDDALNVIAARDSWSGNISDLVVWNNPASNTADKTKIDLTTNESALHLGSPKFLWAEGDVKNGTGYIWYVEANGTEVWRMTVTNMVAIKEMSWPLVDANGNTVTLNGDPSFVHKYDSGKLYIHNRSNAVYDVQVDATKATCTKLTVGNVGVTGGTAGVGGCIVMFKGHKLLFTTVYGASSTSYTTSSNTYSSQVNVYDMSNSNALIATIDDIKTAHAGTVSSVGAWVRCLVNPDNENKLDVFVYKPGTGAAKYSITATEVIHYSDPVQNLKATRVFNAEEDQDATLTWEAPVTGAEHVTGYTIYEGDTEAATVGADVLTWIDTDFTASTTWKVVPNYDTGEAGTETTVTLAPYAYVTPSNFNCVYYDGYSRVTSTWTKINVVDGVIVHYELMRNGAAIVSDLTQAEYIDTYVPPGEHAYAVEAVYYTRDAEGQYTVEVARRQSAGKVITVGELNHTLVNYTLEEVYNYEMWDIWEADRANGSKLPANFNPDNMNDDGSKWVDAEHYRQGALVTDANGNKWWYIMQKSDSETTESTDGTSAGILKISADGDVLKTGGNASMLALPKEIKNGQSIGIATDNAGNIFVRGWNQAYDDKNDWSYNNTHNYIGKLMTGVIYSADLTKAFDVSFENIDFDEESVIAEDADSKERIDYYRVSGDLMSTAYLYVVAGCSRTLTVVKLTNNGTDVTATLEYQYTPTTLDNGNEIKVTSADGYENYAFPIEETLAGSKGYVYQKRSVGYFYVPESDKANYDIYTSAGKLSNAGGTTAKMSNANQATASQLFIITPQSFYSRNIGSFSIGLVQNNLFTNDVVPIANIVQQASEHVIPDGTAGNVNGNWLFAEWDNGDSDVTGDENLYIYQYVPGIRIAKYRLYGNIGFYPSNPDLTITTKHDGNRENITHFEAKATWSTPEDYNGPGDYAIRYYQVDLLDKNNHVIDSREVAATESGDDWKGTFARKDYEVTFSTTADLSNGTGVTVGNEGNFFVDDNSYYTVKVTPVYDLRQVLQGTTTAASDLRTAATMSSDYIHSYDMNAPAGTVQIYKGIGTVKNVYRIEIDIENMEEGEEPVSHYELSYSYTPQALARSGETVTVPIDDFILVTADSQTENQSVVPGVNVRNGNNGYGLTESQSKSYVMFYVDNRLFEDRDGNGYGEYYYPEETDEQIPSNWTYNITAVYAAGNSLLRNSTTAEMTVSDSMIETGIENVEGSSEIAFSAFPIPAESTLTVRAPQGIESISIISAAGVEVKSVAGNGDSVMTIAVDDLASGHYLLRVNNLTPIKIMKQ